MPQTGSATCVHVGRLGHAAAVEQRRDALAPSSSAWPARGPAPHLTHSRTGCGADGSSGRVARAMPKRVVDHVRRGRHVANQQAHLLELRAARDRRDLGRMRRRGLHQDPPFVSDFRIADHDVEHEPIELRLGQRIRAFLFDRVLRGQHEERPIERIAARRRP